MGADIEHQVAALHETAVKAVHARRTRAIAVID